MIFEKNIESAPNALLVFGNGDGGGGPLAPMLENVSRPYSASPPLSLYVTNYII